MTTTDDMLTESFHTSVHMRTHLFYADTALLKVPIPLMCVPSMYLFSFQEKLRKKEKEDKEGAGQTGVVAYKLNIMKA